MSADARGSFDDGGLRRYTGEPETPLLRRVLAIVRAEKDPQFTFLSHDELPWTPLRGPLAEARVALLTTAGLHRRGEPRFEVLERPLGDPSFRRVPHLTPAGELDLEAPYLDRKYTTDDPEVALPMAALGELHAAGIIGPPAAWHASFCAGILRPFPGLRASAAELAPLLHSDGVDALVLIPTCSTCVQTVCLLACELERRGFTTVCLTLLPELSTIVGAPRVLALHFPLGAPCGDPHHRALQRAVLSEAVDLLVTARHPGELRDSALAWRRG